MHEFEVHFKNSYFLWCFFSKRYHEERATWTKGKAVYTKYLLRQYIAGIVETVIETVLWCKTSSVFFEFLTSYVVEKNSFSQMVWLFLFEIYSMMCIFRIRVLTSIPFAVWMRSWVTSCWEAICQNGSVGSIAPQWKLKWRLRAAHCSQKWMSAEHNRNIN